MALHISVDLFVISLSDDSTHRPIIISFHAPNSHPRPNAAPSRGGRYADEAVDDLAEQMVGATATMGIIDDEYTTTVKCPFTGEMRQAKLLAMPMLKVTTTDLRNPMYPKKVIFVIMNLLAALLPDEVRVQVTPCGGWARLFILCPASLSNVEHLLKRLTYDNSEEIEFEDEETDPTSGATRTVTKKKTIPRKERWFHPSHEISTGLSMAAAEARKTLYVMNIKMKFPVNAKMHQLHVPGANEDFKASGMFNCHHPNWYDLSDAEKPKFEGHIGKNRFGYLVFIEKESIEREESEGVEYLGDISGGGGTGQPAPQQIPEAQAFDPQGFEAGSKRPRHS